MAQDKTQFLHFNAYSIKEMIVRKLTEDTNFTDQLYEGSNLNILIDLVAYMYQCLMYNLNNAASESMFADTRLYENINRLVKFIGYNPKSLIPSSGQFYILNENNQHANKYIQRYTAVDSGHIDQYGNQIYFSTMEDIHIDSTNEQGMFKFMMYNGRWQLYNTVFTAAGTDYETFQLDQIKSDTENADGNQNYLVANNGIHVYVQTTEYQADGSTQPVVKRFNVIDDEMFINTKFNEDITSYARVYTRNDEVCNVRLNEKKSYELKFGNGIVGKKLRKGDKIFIMYFMTNGMDGKILLDDYTENRLLHNSGLFGMTTDLYKLMFGNEYAIVSETNDTKVLANLITTTTTPIAEDNVEDIKYAAPEWFKMGQRLITKDDYEFYIKNLRKGEVQDVLCQNNYEYASTYYLWLYQLGSEKHGNEGAETYYLNRYILTKNKTVFADPVDVNNVYLWIKMKDNSSIQSLKQHYLNDIQKIKCITANVIFLDAIDMNFSLTAMPEDKAMQLIKDGTYFEDTSSYLEVTMDNDVMYASAIVAEQIDLIIKKYFNSETMTLGKKVSYNEILENILAINGVERIRTIYMEDENDATTARIVDGLSFASWSNSVIDSCDDLLISSSSRTLMPFHYPKFVDINLKNRIRVIKKSINYGSKMQY